MQMDSRVGHRPSAGYDYTSQYEYTSRVGLTPSLNSNDVDEAYYSGDALSPSEVPSPLHGYSSGEHSNTTR